MEIIQERLEREFNMTVITTVPNVSYHAFMKGDPHQANFGHQPVGLSGPLGLGPH